MKSNQLVKWSMVGGFIGYFVAHPFVMIVGHLMVSPHHINEYLSFNHISSDLFNSFSIHMLHWSISFALFGAISGLFYGRMKKIMEDKSKLIIELQEYINRVKVLSGLLPICANCKKIRDDKGYWSQVEVYIHEYSEAEFSHGICPECMKKLYPDYSAK